VWEELVREKKKKRCSGHTQPQRTAAKRPRCGELRSFFVSCSLRLVSRNTHCVATPVAGGITEKKKIIKKINSTGTWAEANTMWTFLFLYLLATAQTFKKGQTKGTYSVRCGQNGKRKEKSSSCHVETLRLERSWSSQPEVSTSFSLPDPGRPHNVTKEQPSRITKKKNRNSHLGRTENELNWHVSLSVGPVHSFFCHFVSVQDVFSFLFFLFINSQATLTMWLIWSRYYVAWN